jgi:uncharacterized membrane protein YbhN (UPF0104 family)
MLKFFAKLIFGIIIFVFLVWKAGPAEIVRNLSQYKISAVLLINLTTLCGFFLSGFGVIILGKTINPQLHFCQGLKGFLGSASLALFFPGRAGDLMLPFYWKPFLKYGECLCVIFLDKMITLFWVLLFGSCGIYVVFNTKYGFLITLLVFTTLTLLIALFCIPKTRRIVSHILPTRIMDFLQGSVNAFRTITAGGKKKLFTVYILSGFRIILYGVGFWISLWGLDIASPLVYSILVMTIALFATLVPVSILGLGPVEAICVFALAQIQIESSLVMAALIVGRLITLMWLTLFFILFSTGSKQNQFSYSQNKS